MAKYSGKNVYLEIARKDKEPVGVYTTKTGEVKPTSSKRLFTVFGKNGGWAFAQDLTEEELIAVYREAKAGREGKFWQNANLPYEPRGRETVYEEDGGTDEVPF